MDQGGGQVVGLYERVAGQTVEARDGASRSGSGPTRRGRHRVCRLTPHVVVGRGAGAAIDRQRVAKRP
jgi:hypothetical protein